MECHFKMLKGSWVWCQRPINELNSRRRMLLVVIRSLWESESSWEVLEASGSELNTETVFQAEQPRKKQWWQGRIPEECFTEGSDSIHQERVSDSLFSHSLLSQLPGISGGAMLWRLSEHLESATLTHKKTVSLCDALQSKIFAQIRNRNLSFTVGNPLEEAAIQPSVLKK